MTFSAAPDEDSETAQQVYAQFYALKNAWKIYRVCPSLPIFSHWMLNGTNVQVVVAYALCNNMRAPYMAERTVFL
jgi:hypothetical protein